MVMKINNNIDLEELNKVFPLFRKKLLKQIHQFEKENNCYIVAKRNLEFVYFINMKNIKTN